MSFYILFDLDGTITNPGEGITNSVVYALKKMNWKVPSRKKLDLFIGPPLKDSFMKFCEMSEEQAYSAIGYYREYFSEKGIYENVLYDGIEAILRQLKNEGHILGVATSKPTVFAEKIIQHFKLDPLFACVQGSDLEGKSVEKHLVIENALEKLGNPDRNKVLMIGDREHDVIGAKKSKVQVIGVCYGYGDYEELDDAEADGIADDLDELYEVIEVFVEG